MISMSIGLEEGVSGAMILSVSSTERRCVRAVLTACMWFRLYFGPWGVAMGKRSAHEIKCRELEYSVKRCQVRSDARLVEASLM